jgi:predicted TPR repeat methyltransferase
MPEKVFVPAEKYALPARLHARAGRHDPDGQFEQMTSFVCGSGFYGFCL